MARIERLLRDIEADAASLSTSRTFTGTNSTIQGLGTISGKAIMAVGSIVIRGIERVAIQRRLSSIRDHLRRREGFIPREIIHDLLELQRVGLYPRSIRYQAWDCLLTLMKRQRTEHIIDAMLKWPPVEIQLIMRQLLVFKLSEWNLYSGHFTFASRSMPTIQNEYLMQSYRNIFNAVLKHDPRLLHDTFTSEDLVVLYTGTFTTTGIRSPSQEYQGQYNVFGSLGEFFNYLLNESTSRNKWVLPLPANDFVDFLNTCQDEQIFKIVHHVLNALRSFTTTDFPMTPSGRLSKGSESDYIHPAQPYLWFALHLSLRCQVARTLFGKAEFMDIVEQMFPRSFSDPHREFNRSDGSRNDMHLLICMIFGVFSAQGTYSPLARRLKDEHPRLFVGIFLPFVGQYEEINTFRLPSCHGDPPDDKSEFYDALLEHLTSSEVKDDERAWDVFLRDLRPESEIFINEALARLSAAQSWALLVKLIEIRSCDSQFGETNPCVSNAQNSRDVGIEHTASLQNIIHAHLQDIALTHCANSLTDMVQSDDGLPPWHTISYTATDGICVFFNWLSTSNSYDLLGPCTLPRHAQLYIESLSAAPIAQYGIVVQFLMKTMTTLLLSGPLSEDTEAIMSAMPCLRLLCHPVIPFVQFSVYLSRSSSVVAGLFIEQGLPDILLFSSLGRPPSITTSVYAVTSTKQRLVRTRFLLLLGILAAHHHISLVQALHPSLDTFVALLQDLIPTILSVQLCIHDKLDDTWTDFAPSILSLFADPQPKLIIVPNGPRVSDHPWLHLISNFRDQDDIDPGDPTVRLGLPARARRKVAEQILVYCASVDESSWGSLGDLLYPPEPGLLPSIYAFIIHSYLGCATGPRTEKYQPATSKRRRTVFLRRLIDISKANGFAMVHPVDRFVAFTISITHGQRQAMTVLGLESMTTLLKAVMKGRYDLDMIPTVEELSQRRKICAQMEFQMKNLRYTPQKGGSEL
ncbi:hypothetical protein BXZ70DRAFT_1061619 [Cristinia sonorae]|uniref:Uncharacterized protein n=1 Tax=Cristinia sonorae TaxID=1940300 RepID=A0A8K0XU21_9AGAR|nr:hypothetical protein BXZ70DRAFT_1061619 [Cristinia sonorae]